MWQFLISNHKKFCIIFWVVYVLLGIVTVLSFSNLSIARLSNTFGKLAILTYVITLIPGIAKRFEINLMPVTVILLYRRQIGILMFLLALTHMVMSGMFLAPLPFVIVGMIAMIILFLLFVTSNDFCVKVLSSHWHKLQKFTFGAMFFIFLHLVLIRFSWFTLLLLTVMIVELISFIKVLHSKQ